MAGFKSSFASARKAGKSTFTWNGKSYNTKMASGSSGASLPKTTDAIPKTKPDYMKIDRSPLNAGAGVAGGLGLKSGAKVKTPSTSKNASFLPVTKMSNMSDLNDFRQKESRRASDESTKNITGSSLKGAWNSVANKNKYKF